MLFVLAVYRLSQQGVQALPVPAPGLGDTLDSQSCNDLNNCRSIEAIIWSCLVTIFSCTWVAIHPNIPGPDETSFRIGLRRAGIVVLAVLAPELVISWAMRQRLIAGRIADEYRGAYFSVLLLPNWNCTTYWQISICSLRMNADSWIFRSHGRFRSVRRQSQSTTHSPARRT